ncbi:MAG TPA: MFS transporter, partial [Burkholderiales bacterium]|nr:MFS transporter [Burkholderiales bacterium]
PSERKKMMTHKHVHLSKAWKTAQFWRIWAVLCLNVTAGIGVLSMASPMLQEVFGGKLIGIGAGFNDLTPDQKVQIAAVAAGFAGLLSLFNSLGRFFWASISDWIGRKNTYFTFFILGMVLYASAPSLGHSGSVTLFVLAFCVILTMYGGGFATVPAYLADIFGTQMVGAIHGRLLTAWSTAGIVGPVLINYVREFELSHGVQKADAYDITMYILVGLLLLGLVSNALVRPVAEHHHMTEEELEAERKVSHDHPAPDHVIAAVQAKEITPRVIAAWLAVGIPFVWGVSQTLIKASVLFR